MNTVEALKNLYKTMSGKDWPYDPNLTDAEVIDKIAADGNAGGSGGGDAGAERRIFVLRLPDAEENSRFPKQYEPGLSIMDLVNSDFITEQNDIDGNEYISGFKVTSFMVYDQEGRDPETQKTVFYRAYYLEGTMASSAEDPTVPGYKTWIKYEPEYGTITHETQE